MPISITPDAIEGSTYPIVLTFRDETNALVAPSAITWSLLDEHGQVVNDRNNVIIASPASTITIVLSGADLHIGAAERARRRLLVEATYSGSLGADLPLRDEVVFTVAGLKGV